MEIMMVVTINFCSLVVQLPTGRSESQILPSSYQNGKRSGWKIQKRQERRGLQDRRGGGSEKKEHNPRVASCVILAVFQSVSRKDEGGKLKPMFVQFVLEQIWAVCLLSCRQWGRGRGRWGRERGKEERTIPDTIRRTAESLRRRRITRREGCELGRRNEQGGEDREEGGRRW
eukprot:426431-Hanusia_phi.AAC.1